MNHAEFAQEILAQIAKTPSAVPPISVDDSRRRNAGRCMAKIVDNRLAQNGDLARHVRHSFFEWRTGIVALRNSRIANGFWTNLLQSVEDEVQSLAKGQPVAYLLVHWVAEDSEFHAWAIPADKAREAFASLRKDKVTGRKTLFISLDDHQLKDAPDAPNLKPYYVRASLNEAERAKLFEAIKTDDNVKQERLSAAEDEVAGEDTRDERDEQIDETDPEESRIYTDETVAFLRELPSHVDDGEWHEQNKRRYQRVLRDPSESIVAELAKKYIQRLSPAVAAGKRHLSILKKNDYGQGGYHDHYWFAFYDPAAGSKTKSVQLFVRFLGGERVWRYGLSMGNYCGEYMTRLLRTIAQNRPAVVNYLRSAPPESIVRLLFEKNQHELFTAELADRIGTDQNGMFGFDDVPTNVLIIREYPLDALPDHADSFVDEVGTYFNWAWPFFDAAMSAKWPAAETLPGITKSPEAIAEDVDESAPESIGELSGLTALSVDFLAELEDAILAKQQVILVGPPGTSKTYIARQFARYFVRQRTGRPQGSFDALYMHANWGYEDFFEGLKPTASNGSLSFEPRLGFFLAWIERLQDYDPRARHVLILDEINRCDTAAVLGELLQLLEYRGTTVRLMSGRNFVFPSNVFLVGTMNSADRSIGRMDLALRRRFLWLNLFPRLETLQQWLDRPGNNPLGFKSVALGRCNELLAARDISPEQQIGHALFMLQRSDTDDTASLQLDVPLSERKLRQIVRFSVLPYVRELLTLQLGKADDQLLQQISNELLNCVDSRAADGQPEAKTDAGSA